MSLTRSLPPSEKTVKFFQALSFPSTSFLGKTNFNGFSLSTLSQKLDFTAEKSQIFKKLKVSYTPLWDKEGNLDKVMFVVEDITEIDKLETEMKEHKKENDRNLEILQELSLNKGKIWKSFFQLFALSHRVQELGKEIRDKFKTKRISKEEMRYLFQALHNLKGSSRVFGTSHISSEVHSLENKTTQILESTKVQDQKIQKVKIPVEKSMSSSTTFTFSMVISTPTSKPPKVFSGSLLKKILSLKNISTTLSCKLKWTWLSFLS